MVLKTQILLLAATALQCFQSKPAVVEWYLKKQQGKEKPPDTINQNVRAFQAKHSANTHDHEKEWQATVDEVKGEDKPKRKYGKKTPYVPAAVAKPSKNGAETRKPDVKKVSPVKAKTQDSHKFEVKPVTTVAAKSLDTAHHFTADLKSKSGSKGKAQKAHKNKAHVGPGPGPAPAPAPAPAPLDYKGRVSKLKGDMMKKIKGDSFDADFVIERPNKVLPGTSTGTEVPVPEFKDVGGDFGPYAPAAAPLKHDDISFKTGSLPVDAAHVDRQTMTSDWHMEYGPNGPKGQHGTRPGVTGRFLPLQAGSPQVESNPPIGGNFARTDPVEAVSDTVTAG